MTNFQIYRKTLPFSLVTFLVDILAVVILIGLSVAGFFIAPAGQPLIGVLIGLVLGIILSVLINIFISNRIKAAQISMMTQGVANNSLPEHTYSAGFQSIKGRFGKITLFFTITNAIKGAFQQVGRGMVGIGKAIGGNAGQGVAGAIDGMVQTLIGYLCDCCLGWVLYREDENGFKAACEGAAIFFKHGKALLKNAGRIFGMGLVSLLVIGGAFTGIIYLVLLQFPDAMTALAGEIQKLSTEGSNNIPAFLYDVKILTIVVAAVGAVVLWGIIHSVLIRPFILTGVLRNFVEVGKKEKITESDLDKLESISPKFTKMRNRS